MWILFVIAMGNSNSYPPSITSVIVENKEACVKAVEFSKKRRNVTDAWCVPRK